MVISKRVPAAVTGLLLSAVVGVAPAAAQQTTALASDSSFLQMAGSVALLQVKLGKLAATKGSSADVVEYGKRMVTDYSKAKDDLAAAAKQSAYPAPVLLRQHQRIAERFNGIGRSSFDKAYLAEMVNYHRQEVQLFRQEAEGGRVESLKQLAARMLPEVEQRLSRTTQTAASVGVDVTGPGTEGVQGSAGN
jgi:putative membrane protein